MRRSTSLILFLALLSGCNATPDKPADAPPPQKTAVATETAVDAEATSSESPAPATFDRFELLREEVTALLAKAPLVRLPLVELLERLLRATYEAEALAETEAQKAEVGAWKERVRVEHAAVLDYQNATTIVQAREVERFAEARKLLLKIPTGTAHYHEARAFADWIDSDGLMRSAAEAYDRGDLPAALAKVDKALALNEHISGGEASLRERRRRWILAAGSMRQGLTAIHEKRDTDARAALRSILDGPLRARAIYRLAEIYMLSLDGESPKIPDDARALGKALQNLDAQLFTVPAKPKPLTELKKKSDDWSEEFEEWGDEGWDEPDETSKTAKDPKPDTEDWADDFEEWGDNDWADVPEEKPRKEDPPKPPEPPPPLAPTATITGRVQQPSGRPVPGARVSAYPLGSADLTNASGEFTLTVHKAGALEVTVNKETFVPTIVKLESLGAGEVRDLGQLAQTPGGGFKGIFVSPDGKPVEAMGMLWWTRPGDTWGTGRSLEPGSSFEWYPWSVLVADLRFELVGYAEVKLDGVKNGTHDLVITLQPPSSKKDAADGW